MLYLELFELLERAGVCLQVRDRAGQGDEHQLQQALQGSCDFWKKKKVCRCKVLILLYP